MAKWIEFIEQPAHQSRKTKFFSVVNKENKREIGLIRWYGAFRQYSFFPHAGMVFERQCLMDIAHFLNQKMVERKLLKQKL